MAKKVSDGLLEGDLSPINELENARQGRDDFGERRQIEACTERHRFAAVTPHPFYSDDLVLMRSACDGNRARDFALFNGIFYESVSLTEHGCKDTAGLQGHYGVATLSFPAMTVRRAPVALGRVLGSACRAK